MFYKMVESGYAPAAIDRIRNLMIYRQKIIAALESKREAFTSFDESFQQERESYSNALNKLGSTPRSELESRLKEIASPGAIPTPEYDRAVGGLIRFPEKFANHQESREWALGALENRKTFAYTF